MRLLAPPLIVLLVVTGALPAPGEPPGRTAPRRARLVRFENVVRNDTDETFRDVRCDLLLPEDGPGQRVRWVRLSGQDWQLARDAERQWSASARIESLPPGESVVFAWLASVELFPPGGEGEPDELTGAERERALADEARLLFRGPTVDRAGRAVRDRARGGSPVGLAAEARDYVRESVRYELAGGWRPVPEVLGEGSGSCSETTFAFVAICRELGIPARWVGGTVDRGALRGVAVDSTFHRQAEVWLRGRGWVRVETTPGPGHLPVDDLSDGASTMLVLSRACSSGGAAGLYYHARNEWSAPKGSGARPRVTKRATWLVDAARVGPAAGARARRLADDEIERADRAGFHGAVEPGRMGPMAR